MNHKTKKFNLSKNITSLRSCLISSEMNKQIESLLKATCNSLKLFILASKNAEQKTCNLLLLQIVLFYQKITLNVHIFFILNHYTNKISI